MTSLILAALCALPADGPGAWWVFFSDRGPGVDARVEDFADSLAPACLSRRVAAGIEGGADEHDLEPWEGYSAAVEEMLGPGRIRTASRFLNAVSVEASESEAIALETLPFVSGVRPVSSARIEPLEGATPANDLSSGQLAQVGVDVLSERGLSGGGITVGILDTGFNLAHAAFDGTDIAGCWDFIGEDPEVGWEPGDPAGQAAHGTAVLSVLGGFQEGEYSGAAPGATFLLAKTEDTSGEYPGEEDFWIEGLEWLDLEGADLVSSSLGYIQWYTYEDMDGNTALTTIAADLAASRGMPVVCAIGNYGPGYGSLIAPSDGDSVFAVGGVDARGDPAPFTSEGPTFDGRIKPEVCARAVYVIVAMDSETGYMGGNGTSFAAPMVSGAVALLLEAHPEWTVFDALEAVKATARDAAYPGPVLGWGVMDAVAACAYRSVTGCVRNSSTGDPIPGYPLLLSIGGEQYALESGVSGWFAFCPGTTGDFTLEGAGYGCPLPVSGTLGEAGVEVTIYVDAGSSVAPPSAYPVPSDEGVWIGFDLAGQAPVSVTVLDVCGSVVACIDRGVLPAGSYRAPLNGEAVWWDGCSDDGEPAASGTYLALLDAGGRVTILKLAILR